MSFFAKNILKTVFFLSFFPFFTKCNFTEVQKEAPEINNLKTNTKFVIKLPENHTTGYIWQLSPDFDKKTIENSNVVWHGNEKGVYFHFKSLSVGQTTLTFVNRKYTDTSDIKSFIVNIKQ